MASLALASFTLASILSSLPSAGEQVGQSVITTHISPAIAGQWEIDLTDLDTKNSSMPKADTSKASITVKSKSSGQCRELYNFAADNEMWSVSGKEWTYGRYLVTHRDEGLPVIAMKTVYDNNEEDCSGNKIDQTDESFIAFLKHQDNKMQWCADSEGKECFMTFHRVRP